MTTTKPKTRGAAIKGAATAPSVGQAVSDAYGAAGHGNSVKATPKKGRK